MSTSAHTARRIPILYFIFMLSVLSTWGWYMISLVDMSFLACRWAAALTMIFGSFIAGSSPEGSAAISYPVFTLLLKIPPPVARNFSFAIQSIGMTSASLLILGLHVRVDWNYIRYVTIGGLVGLIFGTYYVVPLISPVAAKLFFVSLWLSFGITLWRENRNPNRIVFDAIPNFGSSDQIRLALFGLVGGVISSIFGPGINIFTFCLVTIYYRLNEKVATPSSVIIMTIETLPGFFLHAQILHPTRSLDYCPPALHDFVRPVYGGNTRYSSIGISMGALSIHIRHWLGPICIHRSVKTSVCCRTWLA